MYQIWDIFKSYLKKYKIKKEFKILIGIYISEGYKKLMIKISVKFINILKKLFLAWT